MKNLGASKDLSVPLTSAVLDGRSGVGMADLTALRVALNVSTWDERGRSRLPGFVTRTSKADGLSNEDLHDQLLEASAAPNQREAVTLLYEAPASTGVRYSIAATKSRIYASTGQGRNWRLLADGFGANFQAGESPWARSRWQVAQVGDVLLFTNGLDPVQAWPLGGPLLTSGTNAGKAAFPVYDLQGLEITRAGCIGEWNGFAFIGDVTISGTEYGSQIFWSDFNAPQQWAPGGQSLSGFYDFGAGEQVLIIATIGGTLRVYTDKAIYAAEMVGGDAVFKFTEVYRGDLSVAYPWSFVNMGDTHLWMNKRTILTAGQYDRVPQVVDWVHRAAGLVFDGLEAEVLRDCPVPFEAFDGLDTKRCHQIVSGWDGKLENAWLSWPTLSVDENDPEGVRRVTMILNPRYNRATLVDYGLSACAEMRRERWQTVRDFLLQYRVCDAGSLLSDAALRDAKEGMPLNYGDEVQPPQPAIAPTCIWNPTEDPALPMSDTSVAYLVQHINLAQDCAACVSPPIFVVASSADFALKEFDVESRWREVYLPEQDVSASFPLVSEGAYAQAGYPTLLQGEYSKYGTKADKTVHRAGLDPVAEPQLEPGKVYMQVGMGNAPRCVEWRNARPVTLDCIPSTPPAGSTARKRKAKPTSFPFYCRGAWGCWRVFVGDKAGNLAPRGSGVVLSEVTLYAGVAAETWTNE